MKKFLIGLAVGAAAVYAASKLIDEDTKEELYDKFNKAKDDAEHHLRRGKRKAMRAGIKAKQEVLAGKERASHMASNLLGKASDDLDELDEKLKEKAGR